MVSNVVRVLRKELRQQKKEGLQEGLLEGRAEGLREGEQKERIAMISRMKERGLSVEEISELTGLPQDELNKITGTKSTTDPS